MTSQALGRLSRWLQQIIDSDERYICAACNDRFLGRGEGVAHVVRCHPDYAGVLANEAIDPGQRPFAEPCPTRTIVPATRPLMPAAG
jgi:hypothetical protein